MKLSLTCLLILLVGLPMSGCDKKPVDLDEDAINTSGSERTYRVLSDCDDQPVPATQTNADFYCVQYGYQKANDFASIPAWCGADGGNSSFLYEVTCWKPL